MTDSNTPKELGEKKVTPTLPPKVEFAIQNGKIGVQETIDLYSLGKYPIYTTEFHL